MNAELIRQLRASSAAADPVPEAVLHGARTAYAWAGDDSVVAGIAHDSAVDDVRTARGPSDARVLELVADAVRVSLEVVPQHARRSITGQLDPMRKAQVWRRRPDGATDQVAVDELGRFALDEVAAGPFSLRIDIGDRSVATEWVAL